MPNQNFRKRWHKRVYTPVVTDAAGTKITWGELLTMDAAIDSDQMRLDEGTKFRAFVPQDISKNPEGAAG